MSVLSSLQLGVKRKGLHVPVSLPGPGTCLLCNLCSVCFPLSLLRYYFRLHSSPRHNLGEGTECIWTVYLDCAWHLF